MAKSKTLVIEEKIMAEQRGRMIEIYKPHGIGVVCVKRTFRTDTTAKILVRHPSWTYQFRGE